MVSLEIVTVAVTTLLVPPAPVQVNEYVVVAVSAPVGSVPLVVMVPFQPPPDEVQEVALVELHVSMEAPPLATTVGYTLRVAMGMTLTGTLTTVLGPPGPVQINE
jgi:hypothetical protein